MGESTHTLGSPSLSCGICPFDAASNAEETVASLNSILQQRFVYTLQDINTSCSADAAKLPKEKEGNDAEDESRPESIEDGMTKADDDDKDSGPLGRRLNRTMLLRRICQLVDSGLQQGV